LVACFKPFFIFLDEMLLESGGDGEKMMADGGQIPTNLRTLRILEVLGNS
jgi:hypothetical protein